MTRSKPDIDEILQKFALHNSMGIPEVKQALYHRLAAEAVFLQDQMGSETIEALPISKLKAIMEIKEL